MAKICIFQYKISNPKDLFRMKLKNFFTTEYSEHVRIQPTRAKNTKIRQQKDLTEIFKKFGDVSRVYVHPVHPFGFVTFVNESGVDNAMRSKEAILLNGKKLIFNRKLAKHQENDIEFTKSSKVLKIQNINISKAKIASYFNENVGKTAAIKIRKDANSGDNYCLIEFCHEDATQKAIMSTKLKTPKNFAMQIFIFYNFFKYG